MVTANVPLQFKIKDAIESLRDQNLFDVIDHGIGSVHFTLSDQPPGRNWVLADGKTTFPNEPEVPIHLRGKPVPNMGNSTIAVDTEPQLAGIGRRVEGTLAAQVVNGSSFTLPAPTSKQIAEGEGNSRVRGGHVVVMFANDNYKDVQNGFFWGVFGGKGDTRAAVYQFHPQGTQTVGSVEIRPSTHTFMRAYVRIR